MRRIYAGICACRVLQALKLSQSLFHSLNVLHIKQSISLNSAEILSGHLSIKTAVSAAAHLKLFALN